MDARFISQNGGKFGPTAKRMCKVIYLDNVLYDVNYNIKGTWQGNKKGVKTIKVDSGRVFIGDICYLFSYGEVDDSIWEKFLNKTNYLKNLGNSGFSIDTGGDGEFKSIFKFKQGKMK